MDFPCSWSPANRAALALKVAALSPAGVQDVVVAIYGREILGLKRTWHASSIDFSSLNELSCDRVAEHLATRARPPPRRWGPREAPDRGREPAVTSSAKEIIEISDEEDAAKVDGEVAGTPRKRRDDEVAGAEHLRGKPAAPPPSAARALSQDVLGTILGYLVKPGASAAEAAGALVVCSVVSKEWKRASEDSVARLLGSPWCALYLRASPLFRQQVLVARHAAGAYRESGRTTVWCGGRCYEGLKFACTTRRADEAGASFEMRDLSFVFELFELNSASLRRTEYLADIWNEDCSEADEGGWERPPPPEEDFAAEARQRARGRPHFVAARDDLGDDEENLVWTATARADADGRVEALASWPTIPVDSGMDDYYSFWLNQFRLVVTVVRDTDAKMCQIVDVRGWKAGQRGGDGFYEIHDDGETGGAAFRVVDCDGDGDLDAHLYFCTKRNDQAFVHELPGKLKKICLKWSDADDAALRTGPNPYFPEVCQGNDADVATVASKLATLHWI